MGAGPQGVGDRGRDLPSHPLRAGSGAVVPRSAGRVPRASHRHLRRQQGVCDDRVAHRARPRAGEGGEAMAALQSHTTTGANHPAQWAAAAALGDERVEQDVVRMVAEFRKRRELVVGRFRQKLPGVEFVEPLGAFYFFFRVDSLGGISGTEFCTRLITSTGVALVPGAAFGDDRYVRLSYAAATDDIAKALDRIVGFAEKLAD